MSYPVRPSWRGQGGGRRDPFASLEAVQDRFNRLLGDALTGYRGRTPFWHPDIDIDENDDGWVVEARLPGVAPDEVAIDVNDRELVIRAAQTEESTVRSRYSDFSYRLTLPYDVDADAIDATMDHGLLVVRLPRSTTSRSRRISVAHRIEQASGPTGSAAGSGAVTGPGAGSDAVTGPGAASSGEPDRPVSDVSEATESDAQSTAAYDVGVSSDANRDNPIPVTDGKNLPGA